MNSANTEPGDWFWRGEIDWKEDDNWGDRVYRFFPKEDMESSIISCYPIR